MTLPNDWRGRRFQQFKDVEAFGQIIATTTTGSVVLNAPTARVGDLLIYNAGSGNAFYNLGVSGGDVVTSTSGTQIEAGAKITYEDVGFDVVALITSAGNAQVFIQKIYSNRP